MLDVPVATYYIIDRKRAAALGAANSIKSHRRVAIVNSVSRHSFNQADVGLLKKRNGRKGRLAHAE